MIYTFRQAKEMLSDSSRAHLGTDIGKQINHAIQALAGLNGWEFLRKLIRVVSATPVITLPQGVAGLVRACVNGTPASIHGTDYQFLHSGPGDLRRVPHGFRMLASSDIADLGFSPLYANLRRPSRFVAASGHVTSPRADGTLSPQPPLRITGITVDGLTVTHSVPVVQDDPSGIDVDSVTGPLFSHVESVVLGDGSTDHIKLYAVYGARVDLVAEYHPSIKVPRFHQYRVAGGHGPFDVMAEVRIEPMPLIDDDDIVPLPSLEPIRYMFLYDANMVMNECQTAQQYLQQAVTWLQQMQTADNTVQTPVVVNTLFDGSVGELAEEYYNL